MIARVLRNLLPPPVRSRVKVAIARVRGLAGFYERIYDRQAAITSAEESIGGGDWERIGRLELEILQREGLRRSDTVVDLGCGTGRLAVQLIPWLTSGRYVGIDISRRMLREAERRAAGLSGGCTVSFQHQRTARFALEPASVDVLCAFSVFTHVEAEDTYRYFVEALRVVKPAGKLIFSCLPLSLAAAREIFLAQAKLDLQERWAGVRNFATTEETMETLARMAGWQPLRWHPADALGQATCVLQRPVS